MIVFFYRVLFCFFIISFLSAPIAAADNLSGSVEKSLKISEEVKKHWKAHPGFDKPLWFLVSFDQRGHISQVKFDESLSPVLEVEKRRAATVENLTNYVLEEYRGVRGANDADGEISPEVKKMGENFLSKLVLEPRLFSADGNQSSKKKLTMHVALCNKAESISVYSDDLNLLPWLEEANKKIHKVWRPPGCLLQARVTFRVNRDGSVSDAKVTPPVDSFRDPAALKAVLAAAPYKPLPVGAPKFIVVKLVLGWVWPLGWRGGKYRSF
jgi:hypothetical protein